MTDIEQITNHVERAGKDMLYQFRTTEQEVKTVPDFAKVLAKSLQILEDCFHSMIDGRSFLYAQGKVLDDAGLTPGQPRPTSGDAATNDDAYRALIFAKVASNISEGRIPNVINILSSLGVTNLLYQEVYPAGIVVEFNNILDIPVDDVVKILEMATAPISITAVRISDHPFGFEDDPNAFGWDDSESPGRPNAGIIGESQT